MHYMAHVRDVRSESGLNIFINRSGGCKLLGRNLCEMCNARMRLGPKGAYEWIFFFLNKVD